MDAGCLQCPTLATAAATCCSPCCCNVPSTHGHCQILSNTGWRRNSIGVTFQHPRGVLYAKRRRGRRSSLVEASIVNDVAVVAMAAVAAAVLPVCSHFLSKARSSVTPASSSSSTTSPASSTMTAALEAVGLSSSTVITDDTPASLRLGVRDTVDSQSGLAHPHSHASPLNSKDEDSGIGAGWSSSSGTIGSAEGGTRCGGSGAHLVTVASSFISPAILLEPVDKERRPTDPDLEDLAVTGYSDVSPGHTRAGLLVVGISTWNVIESSKGGFPSEREAIANGVSAPDVDSSCSSANEPNKNDLESVPRDIEPRVNGVSAWGGNSFHYDTAIVGPKEDHQTLCPPIFEQSFHLSSSHSLSASLDNKSSLPAEEDHAADGNQTVRKKLDTLLHHDIAKALAPQTETERGLLDSPHGDIDERTNGSCSLSSTSTEQDRNEVGNAVLDEYPCQAEARQNGSVFSTSESPSIKRPKSNRRKQRSRESLADLWEAFLRVQDGSKAEVLGPERYERLYQKLLSAERSVEHFQVIASQLPSFA